MPTPKILLTHGSGGKQMQELIKNSIVKKFDNPILNKLSDAAVLPYPLKLGLTTDSFVVKPVIFPGGDIGKLSICGTVNDLVMQGAIPEFISAGIIAEDGLDMGLFERIITSMAAAAKNAGVFIVTGDLKVVEKSSCDKIFINTSGVGKLVKNRNLSANNIESGDKIIITGDIGLHGFSILSERNNLGFDIKSDCACLNGLLLPVLEKTSGIKFMRDPTRGGVATTLNEIAQSTCLGIEIQEKEIPV